MNLRSVAGKKSWMSLLVLAIAICAIATGCAKKAEPRNAETGAAATNSQAAEAETVSFSYLRPVWNPATYVKGGAYEKELAAAGNVNIDVQIIPVGEYLPKVNAIIASGKIPDVMWGAGPFDKVWNDYEKSGVFLRINEYLDKYPAIKAAIPDSIWNSVTHENGDIYFIPNVINPIVAFMNIYRKDWFDKLNISPPTTTQAFVEALQKIKESDPDGNGKIDTVPYTLAISFFIRDLATSFDVCNGCWAPSPNDPNWLEPWFVQEKTMDFHVWLQDLHKKGLLDPEYDVNPDPSVADARFKAGEIAVKHGKIDELPALLAELKKTTPDAELAFMPPLVGPGGKPGGTLAFGAGFDKGMYVSAKAKDPDGFFKYLNWTLTDGSDMRYWGVEGKTYQVVDGEKAIIPDADREPDYKGAQVEPLQLLGRTYEELKDLSVVKKAYESEGLGEAFVEAEKVYQAAASNVYADYKDPKIITPTETEKWVPLYMDYMNDILSGFVINHKLTKQDWMNAVEKWRKNGGDKIIEEVNQMQQNKSKPQL